MSILDGMYVTIHHKQKCIRCDNSRSHLLIMAVIGLYDPFLSYRPLQLLCQAPCPEHLDSTDSPIQGEREVKRRVLSLRYLTRSKRMVYQGYWA